MGPSSLMGPTFCRALLALESHPGASDEMRTFASMSMHAGYCFEAISHAHPVNAKGCPHIPAEPVLALARRRIRRGPRVSIWNTNIVPHHASRVSTRSPPCENARLGWMRRRTLRGWTGGERTIFRNGSNISDVAWRSAGVPGARTSRWNCLSVFTPGARSSLPVSAPTCSINTVSAASENR